MKISATTKISSLIKANPASIETIASIDKRFEKLKSPFLRKVFATRISIADAAKIGNCSIDVFFEKLKSIGFEVEKENELPPIDVAVDSIPVPEFVISSNESNTQKLDVREELENGRDPFQKIMNAIEVLPKNFILQLINTFEPVPLINILSRKGFLHYTKIEADGIVYTYFKRGNEISPVKIEFPEPTSDETFLSLSKRFFQKSKTIDVRNLEMPGPMLAILEELKKLPADFALVVHHKKIPQFLFPELQEMNFNWSIAQKGENEVDLIIYK